MFPDTIWAIMPKLVTTSIGIDTQVIPEKAMPKRRQSKSPGFGPGLLLVSSSEETKALAYWTWRRSMDPSPASVAWKR